jgi:hypothetical protein
MQAADLFDYLMRFRDGEPRSMGWEPHHETAAARSVKRHLGLAYQGVPIPTYFHDALQQLTNNAQKIGRKL